MVTTSKESPNLLEKAEALRKMSVASEGSTKRAWAKPVRNSHHETIEELEAEIASLLMQPQEQIIQIESSVNKKIVSGTYSWSAPVVVGSLEVHLATKKQIPKIFSEIARLREISFRALGEGTGEEEDRDLFDDQYLHLFIWNKRIRRLEGAYRLGLCDLQIEAQGLDGVYSHQFACYKPSFFAASGATIDAGRTFLIPEAQGGRALHALFKGISSFIVQNPRYRRLIGGASISSEYNPVALKLVLDFMFTNFTDHNLAAELSPINPPNISLPANQIAPFKELAQNIHDFIRLNQCVRILEPNKPGIPPLMPGYTSFGAKIIGAATDLEFNSIDVFMIFDFWTTPHASFSQYFSTEVFAEYLRRSKLLWNEI